MCRPNHKDDWRCPVLLYPDLWLALPEYRQLQSSKVADKVIIDAKEQSLNLDLRGSHAYEVVVLSLNCFVVCFVYMD